MSLSTFSLVVLSYCFSIAFSFPHLHDIRAHSEPIAPSIDPFYTAPIKLEATTPGTILRIRPAPGNLTSIIANSSLAYNILYRTTDSNYNPSWAVTTLIIPSITVLKPANQTSTSLLSLQVPYDSSNLDASPSYYIYQSAPVGDIPATTDDIAAALGNGWYINMPDYEGPLASFGLGIQAGHATLDSVRAVLSSSLIPSSNTTATKVAMWGYSGGSIASEWAAELQEQYAPDLHFSGAALGGLVPNASSLMDNITASSYAGLIPSFLVGMTSQDADAYAYLLSRLHSSGPYNASHFLSVRAMNAGQAFAAFAMQDIYSYFLAGRSDLFSPSSLLAPIINKEGYMGYHGVPRMPVFVYKAIHDEFTNVRDTDVLVERWCGVGLDVKYQRNEIGGHIAEITNGRGRALGWLREVFEGGEGARGCVVENVVVNITSNPA
jgi:hypothetical protein